MVQIKYNLLPKQKAYKYNTNVNIDLFSYATELYEELNKIGIFNRCKEIPQLGVIRVPKKLAKNRYDYIMLQLYLHNTVKTKLKGILKVSYNNPINTKEFEQDYMTNVKIGVPTIGDALQVFTLVYNIGHFYNTFTASQAVVMLAHKDKNFFEQIINASANERYRKIAKTLLANKNYQKLHLLNSILILEQCDTTKPSIILSLELLYSYLNEDTLSEGCKLKYIFSIFRCVRTVSYLAYDLQIAKVPFSIDICDEEAICILLKELLAQYNNNESISHMMISMSKLLDDNVYHEISKSICYYRISCMMASKLSKHLISSTSYYNLLLDKNSILNDLSYAQKIDYDTSYMLKLTFSKEERDLAETLISKLEKIQNTRFGYYDRHTGETTILVAIKNKCSSADKITASFKTMKTVVTHLYRFNNIPETDIRYILCTKFFLRYLFKGHTVAIKPTLTSDTCVICTRGKKARIKAITNLLAHSGGNNDQEHEVKFLLDMLSKDLKNDLSILIPSSIVVYRDSFGTNKYSEFDGMIIYPMRTEEQIVFLEAKNTTRKPSKARKCLRDNLLKFIDADLIQDIQTENFDAYYKYSL